MEIPANCEIGLCTAEGRHRWGSLLVCDQHWAVIEDANAGRLKPRPAPPTVYPREIPEAQFKLMPLGSEVDVLYCTVCGRYYDLKRLDEDVSPTQCRCSNCKGELEEGTRIIRSPAAGHDLASHMEPWVRTQPALMLFALVVVLSAACVLVLALSAGVQAALDVVVEALVSVALIEYEPVAVILGSYGPSHGSELEGFILFFLLVGTVLGIIWACCTVYSAIHQAHEPRAGNAKQTSKQG